jgi:CBS domain-containing protein
VKDVISGDLFRLRPGDSTADALSGILGLGITGAPVVDHEGRPLGMLSLRDLLPPKKGDRVVDRMSAPAAVVREDRPLAEAGRLLVETGYRRLVVVDSGGRAVGVVSALDLVRGLLEDVDGPPSG